MIPVVPSKDLGQHHDDDGDNESRGGARDRRPSDGVALVDHVDLPSHAEAVVGLVVDEVWRVCRHSPVDPAVLVFSPVGARKFQRVEVLLEGVALRGLFDETSNSSIQNQNQICFLKGNSAEEGKRRKKRGERGGLLTKMYRDINKRSIILQLLQKKYLSE